MSNSWSNNTSSLIVLIEEVSGFSGIFGYSPAPGAGSLVFSLSAAAGTDPYGNKYPVGLTVYDPGNFLFANMQAGKFLWGQIVAGAADFADAGEIAVDTAGDTVIVGNAAALTAFTDAVKLRLVSGEPNQHGGLNLAPYLLLLDAAGTSQVDLGLSGALVKVNLSGAFESWQAPQLVAGWSAGGFSGDQAWQYRRDGMDNLVLDGELTSPAVPAGTTTSILSTPLPVAYRPAKGHRFPIFQSTGNGVFAQGIVHSDGNVFVTNATALGAGAILGFEVTIPLGNIN
jgi:hypothetical protein